MLQLHLLLLTGISPSTPHLADKGHGDLQAGRRCPVPVEEGERPAAEVLEAGAERGVSHPDDLGHVDAGLVEVLGLLRDLAVVLLGRPLQQPLQDDLQLVSQNLEGGHAGPVKRVVSSALLLHWC